MARSRPPAQAIAIAGEVLKDGQVGGVRQDRHQVGLRHLEIEEFQRRLLRADLIRHRHARLGRRTIPAGGGLVLDLAWLRRGIWVVTWGR